MDIYELTIIGVLIAYSLGLVLYIRYMFSYEKIADLAISLIKEASSDKETMEEVYKMGGLFGAGLTKQVGGLIGGGRVSEKRQSRHRITGYGGSFWIVSAASTELSNKSTNSPK